jgi:hypothetical protein
VRGPSRLDGVGDRYPPPRRFGVAEEFRAA